MVEVSQLINPDHLVEIEVDAISTDNGSGPGTLEEFDKVSPENSLDIV